MCEHESHPSVSCELSSSPPTSSAGCWRGQRGSRALQPPPFSHITLCLPSKQALVYGTIVVLQTYKLAPLGALFLTPGKSHRVFTRARKAATRPSTAEATSRGALPISCFSVAKRPPACSRAPCTAPGPHFLPQITPICMTPCLSTQPFKHLQSTKTMLGLASCSGLLAKLTLIYLEAEQKMSGSKLASR